MLKKAGWEQSDMDFIYRSSGGPVLYARKIVGVISLFDGATPHGVKRECKGATFFDPITHLKDNLKYWPQRF